MGFLHEFSDFHKENRNQKEKRPGLTIKSYNIVNRDQINIKQASKRSHNKSQPEFGKSPNFVKNKIAKRNPLSLNNKTLSLCVSGTRRCKITGRTKLNPLNLVKDKGFSVRKEFQPGKNIYKNSRWGLYRGSFYNIQKNDRVQESGGGGKSTFQSNRPIKYKNFHNLKFLNKKKAKTGKNPTSRLGDKSSALNKTVGVNSQRNKGIANRERQRITNRINLISVSQKVV